MIRTAILMLTSIMAFLSSSDCFSCEKRSRNTCREESSAIMFANDDYGCVYDLLRQVVVCFQLPPVQGA